MEIKHILWPTDMSEAAAQALPHVLSLAEKYSAKVTVLHVQEEITRFEFLSDSLHMDETKRVRERILNNTKATFDKVCSMLGEKCALFDRRLAIGDPAEEILNTVEKENVDLVVMATHGYGGLKRFAYGSVAEKVVHNPTAPVLTVCCKKK